MHPTRSHWKQLTIVAGEDTGMKAMPQSDGVREGAGWGQVPARGKHPPALGLGSAGRGHPRAQGRPRKGLKPLDNAHWTLLDPSVCGLCGLAQTHLFIQ